MEENLKYKIEDLKYKNRDLKRKIKELEFDLKQSCKSIMNTMFLEMGREQFPKGYIIVTPEGYRIAKAKRRKKNANTKRS